MKEQIQITKEKISELSISGFDEVRKFLKSDQFQKAANKHLFWNSNLPTKWAKDIINLPERIEHLFDYFDSPNNINQTFIKEIATQDSSLLKKSIKLSRAYRKSEHWESFLFFKTHIDPSIKVFYKELDFLNNLEHDWDNESRLHISIIQNLDFEDILVHTVSYFEKFKRSEHTIENKSLITSHEMTLCHVLNELLNIKRGHIIKNSIKLKCKYSTVEFHKVIQNALPPINSTEGLIQEEYLPIEHLTKKKKKIRNSIGFFFSKYVMFYQIEKYLCGYADFDYIDGQEAQLITNKQFATHWRNDKKSWFQQSLAMNKAIQKKGQKVLFSDDQLDIENENFLGTQKAIQYWQYLNLPDAIPEKPNNHSLQFTPGQLFKLLISFSNFLMPQGRIIIQDDDGVPKVLKRELPPSFNQLFGTGYLYVADEARMLKAITSYFGWGVDLTQPIIDFLTTDLNDSQNPQIDFLARPLIKIGSQYIWLSSFLRDRKWEVLMQKRILNDGLINLNTQTQGIEKGLADNFIEAGFKALASYKYEDKVKHFSGEIDTLAYKDNSLFVIEIKTTHIEENLMRYAAYQALRFEYKAASQLERNLDFIKTNFDSFKKIPELNIECSLEELKIIPLIVSNIFESDDILINEQFLKVSLFELMVILNNDLFETLSSPSGLALGSSEFNISAASVIQSFNRRAPGFNQNHSNPISKEQCNLWSSMDACSPEDIINAIRTRIVWQGLDEMMEFKVGESIPIGPY